MYQHVVYVGANKIIFEYLNTYYWWGKFEISCGLIIS